MPSTTAWASWATTRSQQSRAGKPRERLQKNSASAPVRLLDARSSSAHTICPCHAFKCRYIFPSEDGFSVRRSMNDHKERTIDEFASYHLKHGSSHSRASDSSQGQHEP